MIKMIQNEAGDKAEEIPGIWKRFHFNLNKSQRCSSSSYLEDLNLRVYLRKPYNGGSIGKLQGLKTRGLKGDDGSIKNQV